MSEYKQKTKQKSKEDEIDEAPEVEASDVNIDDILEEIDSVLEENAEEFVRSYIQRADNRGDKREACCV